MVVSNASPNSIQGPSSGNDFDGTRSEPAVIEGPFVDAVAVFDFNPNRWNQRVWDILCRF
jgi:hypothetical protein